MGLIVMVTYLTKIRLNLTKAICRFASIIFTRRFFNFDYIFKEE
jgi:hypothetical protein